MTNLYPILDGIENSSLRVLPSAPPIDSTQSASESVEAISHSVEEPPVPEQIVSSSSHAVINHSDKEQTTLAQISAKATDFAIWAQPILAQLLQTAMEKTSENGKLLWDWVVNYATSKFATDDENVQTLPAEVQASAQNLLREGDLPSLRSLIQEQDDEVRHAFGKYLQNQST